LGIAGATGVRPRSQLFVTRVQLLPFHIHVQVFDVGMPPELELDFELELDAMTFSSERRC